MSNTHRSSDTPVTVGGLVKKNHELINQLDDLEPQVWVGSDVLWPCAAPEKYTGIEHRGMAPVTVAQVARRLGWKPEEIVFLANRNRIPGAYDVDGEWVFDGRHLRIWFDDVRKGVVSLPH
jgi:hypothetical protein